VAAEQQVAAGHHEHVAVAFEVADAGRQRRGRVAVRAQPALHVLHFVLAAGVAHAGEDHVGAAAGARHDQRRVGGEDHVLALRRGWQMVHGQAVRRVGPRQLEPLPLGAHAVHGPDMRAHEGVLHVDDGEVVGRAEQDAGGRCGALHAVAPAGIEGFLGHAGDDTARGNGSGAGLIQPCGPGTMARLPGA
jgi:hypothetical protein